MKAPAYVALVSLLAVGCSEGHARTGAGATSAASTTAPVSAPVVTPASPRIAFSAVTSPSAIVLAREGTELRAVVADEDAHAIAIVPLGAGETRTIALEGTPARVAVGHHLYATVRDHSRVVAYAMHEDGSSEKIAEAVTASEPSGLALTPDGNTVLVTTAFGATLEAFDADALRPLFSSKIAGEPRGLVVSADGARAFVSHATGSSMSVVDLASHGATVREVSLDVRERRLDFGIPGGAWALPGGPGWKPGPPMAVTFLRRAQWGHDLTMIGDNLYLPEALVNPGNAFEPTGYGDNESSLSTHVPHVAHVSATKEDLVTKHISGPDDRACYESDHAPQCTLPTGVATLGNALYIACAGGDFVLEHRLSETYDESPKCFAARKKQRRFPAGRGVRGIAIDPDTKQAFVWSAFDRSITELDLGAGDSKPVRTISIATPTTEMTAEVRLGRELFFATNDPRISNDGRACASCHPDGRQDGLLWPTPKGKRQTPMLAGRVADSAPYDWNGANATLVTHIAQTTKNLHGRGLTETDRAALAAYLTSLRGPDREITKEDAHVAQGRAIFESSETQCSSCHPKESAYADHQSHALQKGSAAFDTPSLRYVAGTAPYFHDGRYATLDELVEKCAGAPSLMGQTKHLTSEQRADLVAFLKTL